MRWIIFLIIAGCLNAAPHPQLTPVTINRNDTGSMQRGAATFFNYCSGCHSLKYARYSDLAAGIGIVDVKGIVDKETVQRYLNFVSDDYRNPIVASLDPAHAEAWFGKIPPDLSLVSRVRGNDWIYSYMKGYYRDPDRPTGVNNIIYPNVGMPHVLVDLQGLQEPIRNEHGEVVGVRPAEGTTLLQQQHYDRVVKDLVHFLDYVGEPHKKERLQIGRYVMLYLVIFSVFSYLYYRETWKDIK